MGSPVAGVLMFRRRGCGRPWTRAPWRRGWPAMTGMVALLAVVTTFAMSSSDAGRDRADRRLQAGVEKFALRYQQREWWAPALELCRKAHENDPTNVEVLRNLALCYGGSGDAQRFEQCTQLALRLDTEQLRRGPPRPGTHRSLARTYRVIGDEDRKVAHLNQALKVGRRWLKARPDSAEAAFSMGKTYVLLGHSDEAWRYFDRARKLKPGSAVYEQAYRQVR